MSTPDLAVLGNLILDDVVLPDGATRMAQPGGAVLYAALGAQLWQVEVGIVSVVGADYPAAVLAALSERGIWLDGVRHAAGPTLRTWLLYEGRRRRVVHQLDGPTHAEVSPGADDLPGDWRPRVCHLAPMPFTVQHRLVARLAERPGLLLSLDPYELVREQTLPAWQALLAGLDLLFLSEDEMELPGGMAEPEPALRRLVGSAARLERLFYKQAGRGGLVFDRRRDRFRRWRPLSVEVVEPTGAGDAFAGGVLAGRLLGDGAETALARGLVSASFALAGPGAQALLGATPDAAARRLAAVCASAASDAPPPA
ncbi:MAG: carbohydrate kinase family protein [Thermoanaerobaculia bacterium]